MTNAVRQACALLGLVIGAAVWVVAFMAYFMTRKTDAGTWVDGLGRDLQPAPLGVQLFLGTDPIWRGWTWFFADIIVFAMLCGIACWLVAFGNSRNRPPGRDESRETVPPGASDAREPAGTAEPLTARVRGRRVVAVAGNVARSSDSGEAQALAEPALVTITQDHIDLWRLLERDEKAKTAVYRRLLDAGLRPVRAAERIRRFGKAVETGVGDLVVVEDVARAAREALSP